MKLFAVRTIEHKEAVGFFWTYDQNNLLEWVLDVCDPVYCEYKTINQPAALVWTDQTDWRMGVDTGTEDPDAEAALFQLVKAGLEFEGALVDFTCGIKVDRWRPLLPDRTPDRQRKAPKS